MFWYSRRSIPNVGEISAFCPRPAVFSCLKTIAAELAVLIGNGYRQRAAFSLRLQLDAAEILFAKRHKNQRIHLSLIKGVIIRQFCPLAKKAALPSGGSLFHCYLFGVIQQQTHCRKIGDSIRSENDIGKTANAQQNSGWKHSENL